MDRFKDLAGQRFGRLTVLSLTGTRTRFGAVIWLCKCDCGGHLEVASTCLKSGNTTSCGCLRREISANRLVEMKPLALEANRTHGLSHTPELRAYCAAKQRCNNPRNRKFSDYGGRGIRFLFTSFEEFFQDIGPRPPGKSPSGKALYSLDRINNDSHYMPGNVRWSTMKERADNQRPRKSSRLQKAAPASAPAGDSESADDSKADFGSSRSEDVATHCGPILRSKNGFEFACR
jgi:hypothetical protein